MPLQAVTPIKRSEKDRIRITNLFTIKKPPSNIDGGNRK